MPYIPYNPQGDPKYYAGQGLGNMFAGLFKGLYARQMQDMFNKDIQALTKYQEDASTYDQRLARFQQDKASAEESYNKQMAQWNRGDVAAKAMEGEYTPSMPPMAPPTQPQIPRFASPQMQEIFGPAIVRSMFDPNDTAAAYYHRLPIIDQTTGQTTGYQIYNAKTGKIVFDSTQPNGQLGPGSLSQGGGQPPSGAPPVIPPAKEPGTVRKVAGAIGGGAVTVTRKIGEELADKIMKNYDPSTGVPNLLEMATGGGENAPPMGSYGSDLWSTGRGWGIPEKPKPPKQPTAKSSGANWDWAKNERLPSQLINPRKMTSQQIEKFATEDLPPVARPIAPLWERTKSQAKRKLILELLASGMSYNDVLQRFTSPYMR